jgi:hypothetical protein
MTTNSPHIIVTPILFGIAHYTQLGTELMERIFREGVVPYLGNVSEAALAASLSLFVVNIVPRICRSILGIYTFFGRVNDRCFGWIQHQLGQIARWMVARLPQDDLPPKE